MAELTLAAYAASQRWSMPEAARNWEAMLADYLETIARRLDETGTCLIGHIKALALFPNGGYLRGSVVSPSAGAGVEGSVPAGCTDLVLSLNAIVYGLDRGHVGRIVCETAARFSIEWRGEIITESNRPESEANNEKTQEIKL